MSLPASVHASEAEALRLVDQLDQAILALLPKPPSIEPELPAVIVGLNQQGQEAG